MSTKFWTDWYDEVLPDVPGCSQKVAKNAIRNAAIEFCERTLAWKVDLDPLNAVANQAAYPFEPPANTRVVRLLNVWYNGKRLTPKTPADLDDLYANWPSAIGTPLYYTQLSPDEVILVPMPNAALANGIAQKVALKPTRASTGLEEYLYEKYLEEIAAGAKARLMLMQKKPWSNTAMGAANQALFEDAIASARYRAAKGYGAAPIRVRARFL